MTQTLRPAAARQEPELNGNSISTLRDTDGWSADFQRLRLSLPLPPPDNHCHLNGRFSRYATQDYRDWLRVAALALREALAGQPCDDAHWWGVEAHLWLGARGDGPNYVKPLLDLLGGSRMPAKGERDADGKPLEQSKVLKTREGLFDDDRRVRWVLPNVEAINCAEPRVVLVAFPVLAPTDERQERAAILQAEKAHIHAMAARQRAEIDARVVCYLRRAGAPAQRVPRPLVQEAAKACGVGESWVRRVWRATLGELAGRQGAGEESAL